MRPVPLFVLLMAALALPALAQEPSPHAEKPQGPEMDALSKKLFEGWEKRMYHLGRLGVEKASCKVALTIDMSVMGQQHKMESGATYKWDGKQGSLSWENPQVGQMASQRGLSQAEFDAPFKKNAWREMFKGCKLTAAAGENETVVIVTGGENLQFQMKRMVFDADGVLVSAVAEMPATMGGGAQEMALTWKYTRVGDKYLRSESGVTFEIPGMGKLVQTTKYTHAKVGDYQVLTKSVATTDMGQMGGGTRTVEYSDWKFNDDVE